MPVQMKDVAERAGVSVTTVSHVVNKTRPVAHVTERRVRQALQDLNYYRNVSARLLATGRSDSFGLIISDIENPFFPELIKSFDLAANGRGFDVLLCATSYDPEQARRAVRRMIENKVRGVAVMTSQLDRERVEELIAADVPVVMLDAGQVRRGHSDIRIDYSAGALQAASHLETLGHRRVAFITGPETRISSATYTKALTGALSRRGVSLHRVIEGDNRVEGGLAAARLLIETADLPSAILCGNDLAAIGAMRALQKAGLRTPEDVSVVGSDDIAFASYTNPPLTTVRIPRDSLGHMAFEALERLLRTKRQKAAEYVLETGLVIRQSTAPAKA